MSTHHTPRSPVFLNDTAYGRFSNWPEQQGWNSSTHLAKVDFGAGEEDAYVKLIFLPGWPALANEAIGWQLAHACNIPAPERAAFLTADASFWLEVLGNLPDGCPRDGLISAWCAAKCITEGQQTWVSMEEDAAALAVLKSPIGQKITAFDTWLLHPDRHARNLLRLAGGGWAVIDHELIIDGVAGNWRQYRARLDGRSLLLAKLEKLTKEGRISKQLDGQVRSALVDHASEHIGAIARSLPYISETLEAIEPRLSAKYVLPLIVDRAWSFWMPSTVGKLA